LGVFIRKKGVLKSACFFTLILFFMTFLVGTLFLELYLQEVRLYFVAFLIRWFFLEFCYAKGVLKSACLLHRS